MAAAKPELRKDESADMARLVTDESHAPAYKLDSADFDMINSTSSMAKRFNRTANKQADNHGHSHSHAKPKSIFTAMASAIINFMLMFGLCSAYGMIMFSDDWHSMHRGIGVKMNLSTALIMGLLLSAVSKVKVAIGGPDLNPVVFLGGFIGTIAKELAKDLDLDYPSNRRLFDVSDTAYDTLSRWGHERHLGGSSDSSVEFCVGAHLLAHEQDCQDYHEQLRATTIFATAVATALLALLYYFLGTFKLTKLVSYCPTNIMEAFLSCVGFKVFKYALKFCKYEAKQFIPAACVGVPLYFLKANHVGNPAIVMPAGLLIPLGIFYAVVYGTGSDVDSVRKDNFMFPEITNVDFWQIWTDSIGKHRQIKINAWMKTLPDLVIMLIVCVMDNLLKLSSTESKLPVKVSKDHEMRIHGLGNIMTALCGSSVGYMQLKFNVINYGVMGNVEDRRGGLMYALACGVCFFWSVELANFMPRFFLSALLFFAGAGFVAENLWGSRKYLSFAEWMQILGILAVFIISNSLLNAIIAGCLLVGGMFIVKYAKVPCISGEPQKGGDVMSCERREPAVQKSIEHISSKWLLVIRLKGFLFFASAENVVTHLRDLLGLGKRNKIRQDGESYKHVRYIIFDCQALDDMDSSASKALAKLIKDCNKSGIEVIWSSIEPEFAETMKTKGTIQGDHAWYEDLDHALIHVEDDILDYMGRLQLKWRVAHPVFELAQDLTRQRTSIQPFDSFLGDVDGHFHCPWIFCTALKITAFKTVLWEPGSVNTNLYIVHSGAIALFDKLPTASHPCLPIAVYRHGWFLNRESLLRSAPRYFAIAVEDGEVLYWTRRDWARMESDSPLLTAKVHEEVMEQMAKDMDRINRFVHSIDQDPLHSSLDDMLDHGMEQMASSKSFGPKLSSDPEDFKRSKSGQSQMQNANLRSHKSAGKKKDKITLPPLHPPTHLNALTASQLLDLYGVFMPLDPNEKSILPDMPEHMRHCLHIAWQTFTDGSSRMNVPDIVPALMFAGIYNNLIYKPVQATITKEQFIDIGHEAAMMRFSEKQVNSLYDVFQAVDTSGDHWLDADEIYPLLCTIFSNDLTMEDCISFCTPWQREGTGVMDKRCFLGLMSRVAKKYSLDWVLLNVLKQMWGIQKRPTSDEVEIRQLFSLKDSTEAIFLEVDGGLDLQDIALKLNWNPLELTENLWASGCRGNFFSGIDMELLDDLSCIGRAILVYADSVRGKLPPSPKAKYRNFITADTRAKTFEEEHDDDGQCAAEDDDGEDDSRQANLQNKYRKFMNPGEEKYRSSDIVDSTGDRETASSSKQFSSEQNVFAAPPAFLDDDDAAAASPTAHAAELQKRRTVPYSAVTTDFQHPDRIPNAGPLQLQKRRLVLEEQLRQVKELQLQFAEEQLDLDVEAPPKVVGQLEEEAQHAMFDPENFFSDAPEKTPDPPERPGHAITASDEAISPALPSIGEPRAKKTKTRKKKKLIDPNCSVRSPWFDDDKVGVSPGKSLEPDFIPGFDAVVTAKSQQNEDPSRSSGKFRTPVKYAPAQPEPRPAAERPRKPEPDLDAQSDFSPSRKIREDATVRESVPWKTKDRDSGQAESLSDKMADWRTRTAKPSIPSELGKLVLDLRSLAASSNAGNCAWQDWGKWLKREQFIGFASAAEVEQGLAEVTQHIAHHSSPSTDSQSIRNSARHSFCLSAADCTQLQDQMHPGEQFAVEQDLEERPPPPHWAFSMRALLEDASSSWAAVAISVVITVAILLSLLLLLLKPIICERGSKGQECRDHPNFFYPDLVLSIIFTLEYVARLIASIGIGSEELTLFLKDYLNMFDILAVLPTWLSVLFGNASGAFLTILRICRFLKLARIIRVMKLARSRPAADMPMGSEKTLETGGPSKSKLGEKIIEPCAVVFLVIWAIFMKETLSD